MTSTDGWQRASRIDAFDAAFSRYLRSLVRGSFHTVWVSKSSPALPGGGYVAAANHSSWWDGFIPALIHREADPNRPFAIMMSDAELRRFPFFRWAGAFSVNAATPRRARDAIVYAASLAQEGSGVWIFPQGRMDVGGAWTPFTAGFVHVARMSSRPIVPVALRFAMRAQQRPEAFVSMGAPIAASRGAANAVEHLVTSLVHDIDSALRTDTVAASFYPFVTSKAGIDDRMSSIFAMFRR